MSESAARRPAAIAVVLLVAVVAAVVGVLLVVDASAAEFETATSGTTVSAAATSGGQSPSAPRDVTVVVRTSSDVPAWVRPRVERSVREAFAAEGFDATAASEIPDDGRPVVVVVVDTWDAQWNPATPSATVEWRAVYDANGHERHVEAALAGDSIQFDSRDGPDRVASGDYRLDHSATGLVSRPAYRRHLAEEVGAETARRTADEIHRQSA